VLGFAAPAQALTHVLLLFPYEDSLGTNAPLRKGLSAALHDAASAGEADRVEVYSEFLDSARFPSAADEQRMAEFLLDKYSGFPIDLVVTIGQPAYAFLERHRAELFPEQPWIVAGIRPSTLVNGEVPPNGVAVLSHFDSAGALELALELQPDAREVMFITGASALDARWVDAVREQLPEYADRLTVTHLVGESVPRLLERLRSLPKDTIVVYQMMTRDGNGEHFLAEDLVEPITAAASVPVYGVFDTYLGKGIVGGRFESWETIGGDIGRVVLRLLAGEPQPVRILTAEPTYIVDWQELRRWGLDERRLPAGTAVINRAPSAWEQYGSIVLIVAALVTVQALLIVVWLLRLRKARAERALKLAEVEAQKQREQVTHLTRVAILGQLSGALAHELNQPLTAILSNAQAAQRLLERRAVDLADIQAILDDIVADDVRAGDVIARLRVLLRKGVTQQERLDIGALVADVLMLTRGQLAAEQVTVRTRLGDALPQVQGDRVQLQQVLLNLLLNAVEAMRSNEVGNRRLTVTARMNEDGLVEVAIGDNGPGIDPAAAHRLFEPFVTTKETGLGLGLSICRSIVAAHGGRLSASNNSDHGATFVLMLPAASERGRGAVDVTLHPEPTEALS
jgi:signal transduction histidine kinase